MQPMKTLGRVFGALRLALDRLSEYYVLFPITAVLVLGLIWGATWNLIRIERAAAERAALVSTRELIGTYEAQVVRALREIDQTLKFVKYAYERQGSSSALGDLKDRNLLPADMLFLVSIVNTKGKVVASSRPADNRRMTDQANFSRLCQADALVVSRPWKNKKSGDWALHFCRQLNAADGTVAGAAVVTVEAAYFTSGYEPSKLGEQGVLGLLGTDGVFRVRRTGNKVSAGDSVDITTIAPVAGGEGTAPALLANPWDGVRRYTAAQQIYDFPLAVIVGLSADEQLETVRKNVRIYVWRATLGSALLILVIAQLWRMSRQLELARQNEAEAKMAYAERVEYLAYHDGLTGLPNRSLFSKLLDQSISQTRRYDRQLAVLFLDLDCFKHINDTLGHDAGDELLKEVAVRLKSCLRDSDTVARIGGDEFVVLLPELEDERQAAAVAQKMLTAIASPFNLFGHDFRISVSIGISVYPHDGEDEQTLEKHADIAMYQAKEGGKNNFQFYSEKLNANSLEWLILESGLRNALQCNEFVLHYQAKWDLNRDCVTGMEALLRWQHPNLGQVAPMRFIPIAEETGLIIPIGKWVLATACRQTVAWQKQGMSHLRMAVNLSACQFNDENLLPDIVAILDESGMNPHLLELEISERLLLHDAEKALGILTSLRAMGIGIAINDFGIGYSSISALQMFPIDTIKIDRSFIRDIGSIDGRKDMTAAIIAMGKTLGLTVVAQGIETKGQADLLYKQSCDEFQGFYFNHPLPPEEFTDLLRKQSFFDPEPLKSG